MTFCGRWCADVGVSSPFQGLCDSALFSKHHVRIQALLLWMNLTPAEEKTKTLEARRQQLSGGRRHTYLMAASLRDMDGSSRTCRDKLSCHT